MHTVCLQRFDLLRVYVHWRHNTGILSYKYERYCILRFIFVRICLQHTFSSCVSKRGHCFQLFLVTFTTYFMYIVQHSCVFSLLSGILCENLKTQKILRTHLKKYVPLFSVLKLDEKKWREVNVIRIVSQFYCFSHYISAVHIGHFYSSIQLLKCYVIIDDEDDLMLFLLLTTIN